MSTRRTLALLSAAALAAAVLPAGAEPSVPAVCGRSAPQLAEGERLVEHTVYLRGTQPVGTLSSAPGLLSGGSRELYMSPDEPTDPVSKVDKSVQSNEDFNQNFLATYWKLLLDEEPRMVCAGFDIYGTTSGGATVSLFVEQGFGVAEPAGRVTVAGAGTGVQRFTGNFGRAGFDVRDAYETVLQVNMNAGAVYYDSTAHPSSFTYVTVEAE